jgi:uncharacterized protein YbaR (Trm112 family)
MDTAALDVLCCPICRESLHWRIISRVGSWIENADAACPGSHAFWVRDGIADLLHPVSGSTDLWKAGASALQQLLSDEPEIASRLLGPTPEGLSAADQFLRVFALEASGRIPEALAEEDAAAVAVYGRELRNALADAVALVRSSIASGGILVDLASGRGGLLQHLLDGPAGVIVATDISVTGLRSLGRRLAAMGHARRVSLLAADARRLPLRDGSIDSLTTLEGLPNIEWAAGRPAETLRELRRVTRGAFYNIQTLYPAEDQVHRRLFEKQGLSPVVYEPALLDLMRHTGWTADVELRRPTTIKPSPPSELVPEWRIDTVPLHETRATVCVVTGR